MITETANVDISKVTLNSEYSQLRFQFLGCKPNHLYPRVKIFIKEKHNKNKSCYLIFNTSMKVVTFTESCSDFNPSKLREFAKVLLKSINFINKFNKRFPEAIYMDQDEIENLILENSTKKLPKEWNIDV